MEASKLAIIYTVHAVVCGSIHYNNLCMVPSALLYLTELASGRVTKNSALSRREARTIKSDNALGTIHKLLHITCHTIGCCHPNTEYTCRTQDKLNSTLFLSRAKLISLLPESSIFLRRIKSLFGPNPCTQQKDFLAHMSFSFLMQY